MIKPGVPLLAVPLIETTDAELAESRLAPFRALYEEHQHVLRRTLAGMVGADHCDDLVQEVFLRAWRAWEDFRGESQPKTWLHRIAVNAALDFKKKKTPLYMEDEDLDILVHTDFEKTQVLGDLIEKAYEVLGPDHRSVFVLYYRSEFSVEEIAQTLEIPEGTVKSRLFKARERFIEFLRRSGVQDGF